VSKYCPETCGACDDTKVESAAEEISQEEEVTAKVTESTDDEAQAAPKKSDSSESNPCKDTEGETEISISGKPATCAQLAPYCEYPQFKEQVSKYCPETCGACDDTKVESVAKEISQEEEVTAKVTDDEAQAAPEKSDSSESEHARQPNTASDDAPFKLGSSKDEIRKAFTQLLKENAQLKRQLELVKQENLQLKMELMLKKSDGLDE